jgi:hypothetical protein
MEIGSLSMVQPRKTAIYKDYKEEFFPKLLKDRPVPVEMELHLIKYFVGQRINDVQANPKLLTVERWDHSDVFYQ